MGSLRLVAAVAAAAALVAAPSASAAVRVASISSPVAAGAYASLTVAVSPSATCSIVVHYKSGPSRAQGLGRKRGARITWSWKVGSNTTAGRWPITVSCGAAGSLRTAFTVVR